MNKTRIILLLTALVALFAMPGSRALAVSTHQDPSTAQELFSGVSFFNYYADTLEFILARDQDTVRARAEKIPFVNVPDLLSNGGNSLTDSTPQVAGSIVTIGQELETIKTLVAQSRFTEAQSLYETFLKDMDAAQTGVDNIGVSIREAGEVFRVFSSPSDSGLRVAYNRALDRLQKIQSVFDSYKDSLNVILGGRASFQEIIGLEALETPSLYLSANPETCYVGDDITISGALLSKTGPMSGRKISLQLNGIPILTLTTDINGNYTGTAQTPYWYTSQITAQTVWYPAGGDIGRFTYSSSPDVQLLVLFYETNLSVTLESRAYPGKTVAIAGQIDYAGSPQAKNRTIELYLDDELINTTEALVSFSQLLGLDSHMATGKHLVTVSVKAEGRYAPVTKDITLDVVKAVPSVKIQMPSVILIPGNFTVMGKLESDLGPAQQAKVSVLYKNERLDLFSYSDGSFSTKLKTPFDFSLFGTQDVQIQAVPIEPWFEVSTATRSVVAVNIITCNVFFVILVFLGFFIPGWLKFRFARRARSARPLPVANGVTFSSPAQAIPDPSSILPLYEENSTEPRGILFYSYRLVIQQIQRITRKMLKPQQTLREFINEAGSRMGPALETLLEFTRIIEKTLYSRHSVTPEEAEKGKQMAQKIKEGFKE